MSIPRNMMVKCPKCGQSFPATIFDSINTSYAQDVAISIITGDRFNASCPCCGNIAHLEYDILYHDINHRAMIWVVHCDNEENYKQKLLEVKSLKPSFLSMTRIVPDMEALSEKVLCLEKNRDDRVIELCKFITQANLLERKPNFVVNHIVYTISSNKEVLVFYSDGQKPEVAYVDKNLYGPVKKMFERELREPVPPCAIIDQDWVKSVVYRFTEDHPNEFLSENVMQQISPEKTDNASMKVTFCRKCGAKLLPDSMFCSYCGTKVVELPGR